jgi:hypothetical protein
MERLFMNANEKSAKRRAIVIGGSIAGLFVAGAQSPSKSPEAEDKLLGQALGPAAREFGREVAPVGAKAGALIVRVGFVLIRTLEPFVL